jgi:hypothetical protein
VTAELNWYVVGLFMLVVFPGLISTTVYRLIMPARALEWGNALVQGLFYSAVNFALSLPLFYWLVFGHDPLKNAARYSLAAILVLLILPVLWPIILVRLFKSKSPAQRVHLNDGALIGGFWGAHSYAGSYPNDGDIYLEAVYQLDENGHFGEPIPDTRGVLLRKEQYSYIEMFSVPKAVESEDAKKS